MANVIYRGPVEREPETINLPVNGALVPGTCVSSDGAQFSAKVTAPGRNLLLSNRRFYDQDADTAYVSGETGVAYRLEPEQEYTWAMAADTYAFGDELTVAASGRLAKAVSTDLVVAYYDQSGATLLAGDRADVVIAISYVKA